VTSNNIRSCELRD